MKKTYISFVAFIIVTNLVAQNTFQIKQTESAIVYSLPRAELLVRVKVERKCETPGRFYKYAERFLATNKIISQERISHRIVGVELDAQSVADKQRTYAYVPTKKQANLKLSINRKGVLCAVNIPQAEFASGLQVEKVDFPISEVNPLLGVLPLTEEFMMAGSEAKLAEGAAKQIYRIRESRLALLTSDVEKMPSDGLSLEKMLAGLDKEERKLTELFVGNTTVEVHEKTLLLSPNSALANKVLFRLSEAQGIVDASDLSGAPYYITILPETIETKPLGPKEKQIETKLQSVIPALCQIKIGDGVNVLFNKCFYIPQLGVVVPVPDEILEQPNIKILFDSQNGRLMNIE